VKNRAASLAIIGAGSWGTALAIALGPQFARIRLWVYEAGLAERLRQTRINDVYLPGFEIPAHVEPTSELATALDGASIVLSVMPSHLVRGLFGQMAPYLHEDMIFVSATKGLENETLLRMSQVIRHSIEPRFTPRIAVISGPTFAREVARFEPTALVVASEDANLAQSVQTAFSGPAFRLYSSTDPTGVEAGGSIKNVVAIGAGVLHGMGLGHNASAALITRGLAEMTRLAVAMGGKQQTLSGLAGLGDLVLTCMGELSRNRQVGIELAHGRKLDEIVNSMKMVAEGIKTTNATVDLARRHSVEMPISEQMFQMLHFGITPREAIRRLMDRSLKEE
jgi:glycerol-3-phosphate dehydrogenase (NAD(P)+)